MTASLYINWFRYDLRLSDNPSLTAAASAGTVLPIYILNSADDIGGASTWWFRQNLHLLNKALGGKLYILTGNPSILLPELIKTTNAKGIFWNRCYQPHYIKQDTALKKKLIELDVIVKSFNASLLWEPWSILKDDGTPYRVFTAFARRCRMSSLRPRTPLTKPRKLSLYQGLKKEIFNSTTNILFKPNWTKQIGGSWEIGEQVALCQLDQFLDNKLYGYKEKRNIPGINHTSRLSPFLSCGAISPNTIWHATTKTIKGDNIPEDTEVFLSELIWREFGYYLMYHFPRLVDRNLQSRFDDFPWKNNQQYLKKWQQGQTGIPIVDAGMRELWQTGYMHNRLRMIVGSFLVKNLLINWRYGQAWFWDCLIDADLASNSAGWQWVAGSGVDAAPYFRIFNPITQGKKFDPSGDYTRHYVPELRTLSNKYLHQPWEAPETELTSANIVLGKDYPLPIVDLPHSRKIALKAFNLIKNSGKSTE